MIQNQINNPTPNNLLTTFQIVDIENLLKNLEIKNFLGLTQCNKILHREINSRIGFFDLNESFICTQKLTSIATKQPKLFDLALKKIGYTKLDLVILNENFLNKSFLSYDLQRNFVEIPLDLKNKICLEKKERDKAADKFMEDHNHKSLESAIIPSILEQPEIGDTILSKAVFIENDKAKVKKIFSEKLDSNHNRLSHFVANSKAPNKLNLLTSIFAGMSNFKDENNYLEKLKHYALPNKDGNTVFHLLSNDNDIDFNHLLLRKIICSSMRSEIFNDFINLKNNDGVSIKDKIFSLEPSTSPFIKRGIDDIRKIDEHMNSQNPNKIARYI